MKYIALDMDGTLLNSKKEITDVTRRCLIDVQKKGVRLILASGRPTKSLMNYANELEMEKYHGILVSYNGARAIDAQSQEILYDQAISRDVAKAILEHVKMFDVIPMVDKGDTMYVNDLKDRYIQIDGQDFDIVAYEAGAGGFRSDQADLVSLVDFDVSKILLAGTPEYLNAVYQEIEKPFKKVCSCMFTANHYFEFTDLNVDKGRALEHVFQTLRIDAHDMVAFGDSQNDKTMLEFAGTGIAMANATEEIKDVADMETLSNDEDGIVDALKKLGVA